MDNQYSNDKEFEKFNDLNKSNDNVEFINKAIVRRGYAYYIHEVAHENLVGSLIKNFRDLETFANVPGFSRGLIYRSGYFGSSDPTNLLHILKYVLQVRSIIDLRGLMLNEYNNHEGLQTSMYQSIYSTYKPLVYDCISQCWVPMHTSSSIQFSQHSTRASRYPWNDSIDACVANRKDYHIFSFKTAPVFKKSLFSSQNPFQWMYNALNGLLSFPFSFYNRSENNYTTTSYETENYCKRLLVSGAPLIKIILETVTSVQMPLLICSTDGVHRVGIVSLLILAIVGATHEVLVTDYCASEAGLMLFGQNRNKKVTGNAEMRSQVDVTCNPNNVRRLLEFIKNRWGSIEGYLDYIDFDTKSRKKLKNRLILSPSLTNVLYKIPASAPFWTASSLEFVPETKRFQVSAKELFFPNASMQRILRVVFLLGLRDTLDHVSMENSNNVWSIAKEKLCSMKRKLKHEQNIFHFFFVEQSKKQPWQLVDGNSAYDKELDCNDNVLQLKAKINQKKKVHKIHQSITNMEKGLQEIYLARKIILEKLTDALYTLTRSDIVKFILYRNTQIYAQRNRRISVRKCPDLFDIYLDQPHIFRKKRVRKVQDITKIVVNFLKNTNQIKFLPSTNMAFTNFKRVLAQYQKKKEKSIPYMNVKPHKKISFLRPDFFFHELYENDKKPSCYDKTYFKNTFGKQKPWPKTFRQWLMECWMVSLDSPAIPDPFEETRDECFVPPDILVKYIRYQIQLKQCHQLLFDTDTMNIEETLIANQPVKIKPSFFSLSRNENESCEKKILTVLKEHVNDRALNNCNSLSDIQNINGNNNSTMKQKSYPMFFPRVKSEEIQQTRNTVTATKFNRFYNDLEILESGTKQRKDHTRQRSQDSRRSFYTQYKIWKKLFNYAAKNSKNNLLKNNDNDSTSIKYNKKLYRVTNKTKHLKPTSKNVNLEKSHLKHNLSPEAKTLDHFLTREKKKACNKFSSYSPDVHSLLYLDKEKTSDFDSEEERNWLIQQVFEDPLISYSLKKSKKKVATSFNKKSGIKTNLNGLIQCDASFVVPKFDEYLVNWSLNSFTMNNHASEILKTPCFNSDTRSSEDNDFDNIMLQEETRLHMI